MTLCYFIPRISVIIVYVHVLKSQSFGELAARFVKTYLQNPPGYPHRTVIACNGGMPSDAIKSIYAPIPACEFMEHNNAGYDIGAYQRASILYDCDLMVFFGSSTYFRRPDWLLRFVQAHQKHGPAIYGAMGNRGDIAVRVYPHLRTTAFAMPPDLMNAYPHKVTKPEQRYAFEHGKDCLCDRLVKHLQIPFGVALRGACEMLVCLASDQFSVHTNYL